MYQPKISIITVVYNEVSTIENTLRSVAALTYPNMEYILVDGGSNDGTLEIVKQYENQIAKWITGPDSGLYDAMNKGIDISTGDYLWFINAGDEPAAPDILENVFQTRPLADVYYGQTMVIDQHNNEIGLRRLSPPEHLTWKHFRHGMLVSHQSFIASRQVTKTYDLRYHFSADYDWCLFALKKANQIKNTKLVLSRFRDGGLTKQNIFAGLKERFHIMTKYYGLLSAITAHFLIAPRFFYYWAKHKRF
jgi:glycosyltransferase involved in cell wall biosynthesis